MVAIGLEPTSGLLLEGEWAMRATTESTHELYKLSTGATDGCGQCVEIEWTVAHYVSSKRNYWTSRMILCRYRAYDVDERFQPNISGCV